jgi:hypothetical protein
MIPKATRLACLVAGVWILSSLAAGTPAYSQRTRAVVPSPPFVLLHDRVGGTFVDPSLGLQMILTKMRGGADAKSSSSSSSISEKKKGKINMSKAAQCHVARDLKSTNPNYRIQRELKAFLKDPHPGLSVQVGKNLRVWIVTVQGPGIYKGETFRLRVSFPPQYPTVPPSVYFLPPHLPV